MHANQASRVFWAGMREARQLPALAQAQAAHYAGGPSIEALERAVALDRAA